MIMLALFTGFPATATLANDCKVQEFDTDKVLVNSTEVIYAPPAEPVTFRPDRVIVIGDEIVYKPDLEVLMAVQNYEIRKINKDLERLELEQKHEQEMRGFFDRLGLGNSSSESE